MKKHLIFSFLILIILSSCEIDRTKRMWSSHASYNDQITNFLIREDGKQVVFIGEKYHYILDDSSEILKKLLNWNARSKLSVQPHNFYVGLSNSVELDVEIYSRSSDFSQDEIDFLRNLDFSEKGKVLSKNIKLNGKRYLPKEGVNYSILSPFSRKINVWVKYNSPSQIIHKASLTPITVTIDAISITTALGVYSLIIAPGVILYPTCVFGKEGSCKHNPFVIDWR